MKKMGIIITLLFCFIINVNAIINNSFDISKNYVPNYYRGISDNHYFINDAPFEYSNETLKRNTSFINSGFINTSEYNISLLENATFLNDGLNTWAIDGNNILSTSSKSNPAKITLFTKSNMVVAGRGTYSDPWHFQTDYYTLEINSNNGTIGASSNWNGSGSTVYKKLEYGSTYGTLPVPTKNRSKFLGWYTSKTGGVEVDSETTIYRDTTIYAQYLNSYSVTFDSIDGNINGSSRWTGSGRYVTKYIYPDYPCGVLPTPSKSGYTFDGWYTSENGGTKITSSTIIKSNVVYYAHYSQTYTVTLWPQSGTIDLDSASGWTKSTSGSAIKKYNSGETYGELPKATRGGYKFLGWKTTYYIKSTDVVRGNVNLYAQWEAIRDIEFTYSGDYESSGAKYDSSKGVYYFEGTNWYIKFKSSGRLKINLINTNIDIFIVAGGRNGQSNCGGQGSGGYGTCKGGYGGAGGTVRYEDLKNKSIKTGTYNITVGLANLNSSAFGYTASGGRNNGGVGGEASSWAGVIKNATDGGDGIKAFGDNSIDSDIYYGAGGGGAGCLATNYAALFGKGGKSISDSYRVSGYSMPYGSGGFASVSEGLQSGRDGAKNTGQGGGGGVTGVNINDSFWNSLICSYPGFIGNTGGSGIVIIRNKR